MKGQSKFSHMSNHILFTSNIKIRKMQHIPIDGAGLKIQKLLFVEATRLLLLDPGQFVCHQSFLKPGGRQVFYSLYFGNFVHAHNTFRSFLLFNHHVEYYTHLNRNYCAISKRKCATDIDMQVADMFW